MSDAVGNERAPWGFKILVGAAVLYLVVRIVQIAAWVVGQAL
ncbi:MAG: hypothetical protein WD652_02340 [Acidimicrobiia bacterium]